MENAKNINFDAERNYFRSEKNEGNFVGIVKLLAGENEALAEHLKKCEENAQNGHKNILTFLSKTFIHNALCVVRNFMLRKIVSEIHDSGGYFGILMDGSQDFACKEQISSRIISWNAPFVLSMPVKIHLAQHCTNPCGHRYLIWDYLLTT